MGAILFARVDGEREGCPAYRIHHSQTRKGRLSRGRGLRSSRSKTTSLLHGLTVDQLMFVVTNNVSPSVLRKRDSGKGCSFDEELPNRPTLKNYVPRVSRGLCGHQSSCIQQHLTEEIALRHSSSHKMLTDSLVIRDLRKQQIFGSKLQKAAYLAS